MLLIACFSFGAPLIFAVCVSNAFDANIKAADESDAAIAVLFALIFATHDTALGIGIGFDDDDGFFGAIAVEDRIDAIPCGRVSFVVEEIEVIDGMSEFSAIAFAA